jgi:hypothetical protein
MKPPTGLPRRGRLKYPEAMGLSFRVKAGMVRV